MAICFRCDWCQQEMPMLGHLRFEPVVTAVAVYRYDLCVDCENKVHAFLRRVANPRIAVATAESTLREGEVA